MKHKIVIATDNYLPRWDGITRFLTEIIPPLKEKYDIEVIAPNFGKHEPLCKTYTVPLNKQQWGDFKPARFKRKFIRDKIKNADAVFVQTLGSIGMSTIGEAKKLKIPIISFIHTITWDLVPKALKNPYMKLIGYPVAKLLGTYYYKKCNLLIAPAKSIEDMLSWEIKSVKRKVVYLGCDVNTFRPSKNQNRKKDLGLSDSDVIIGYHGRIAREKDLLTLIRAFTRVQRDYKNIKLMIVGDGLEEIKNKLKRKGVILVGQKSDVVKYLQAMDIYVLTSLTETTCLSVLEAMACRLPVIATPAGFIKDYIKHKKNGLIMDFRQTYVLSRYLSYLISHPAERVQMGISARETVKKDFKWENTIKGIIDAIDSVIIKKV